jgi:FixJ family two-component response regulator
MRRADPPFAALVTDPAMPHMNGSELHRKAAERQPGLRVLYLSGHPLSLVERLGSGDVGGNVLSKPFPIEQLAQAVRSMPNA